MIIIYLYLL